MVNMISKGLTAKQSKFLTAYLGEAGFNATEAARIAGYAGDTNALAVAGHENLRNPKIAQHIQRYFAENQMSPEEIISRLSAIARGSLADFLEVKDSGSWRIDIAKAKRAGNLGLLKKIKEGKYGVEIELWSPLDAMEKLARIHKMYADTQIEIDVKVLNVILESLPVEYRDEFTRAIEAAFQTTGSETGR